MARLSALQMTKEFGRPDRIRGVQVQNRLPWAPPRSSKGTVQVVLVHPELVDVFLEACGDAAQAAPGWVPQRIDSHVVRAIRGKERGWVPGDENTSSHSWCTAWDFFHTRTDVPPPGGVWTPNGGVPAEFAGAFRRLGFTWGGLWNRTDLPHIEWRAPAPAPSHLSGFDADGNLNPADYLSGMLKQGDVGDDVWGLQFMLRALGQKVEPTGLFGPAENAAVREVQKLAKVSVDGIVGPQTEAAILELVGATYPTPELVVGAAYQDVFGRAPDAGGLKYWAGRVSRDVRVDQLWEQLWRSPEAEQLRERAAAPAAALPKLPTDPAVPVVPDADRGVIADILSDAQEIVESARDLLG